MLFSLLNQTSFDKAATANITPALPMMTMSSEMRTHEHRKLMIHQTRRWSILSSAAKVAKCD
jgi:hypothetical protein